MKMRYRPTLSYVLAAAGGLFTVPNTKVPPTPSWRLYGQRTTLYGCHSAEPGFRRGFDDAFMDSKVFNLGLTFSFIEVYCIQTARTHGRTTEYADSQIPRGATPRAERSELREELARSEAVARRNSSAETCEAAHPRSTPRGSTDARRNVTCTKATKQPHPSRCWPYIFPPYCRRAVHSPAGPLRCSSHGRPQTTRKAIA